MTQLGRLSLTEFKEEVENFQAKSELLHEGWNKSQTSACPSTIFLVKKMVKSLPIKIDSSDDVVVVVATALDTLEESFDEKNVIQSSDLNGRTMITLEYHIVYSEAYGVPILYFNAYKPNGKLLSLEEIWSSIPSHYHGVDKWTFLTQHEHPLLGRPFFQLHPCHTETFMAKLGKSFQKRYYLIRWISAVGPAVHLDISLGFANA